MCIDRHLPEQGSLTCSLGLESLLTRLEGIQPGEGAAAGLGLGCLLPPAAWAR